MSYKNLLLIFNNNRDYVNLILPFIDTDPNKKKYNLSIRQLKYNNVLYELNLYYFIKKINYIYKTKSNIKNITKNLYKYKNFKSLQNKKKIINLIY
jgi:hypothetical protein